MDYEKAYKEALERAKEWEKKYILTNTVSPDGTTAKEFKEIFPQLAESEDERMIRILKEGLEGLTVFNYTPVDKIRDWLEKQKEHQENCTKFLAKILKHSAEGFRNILKKKGIDYIPHESFWTGTAGTFSKQECNEFYKWMDDMTMELVTEETPEYKKGFRDGLDASKKEQKPVEYLDKDKVYAIMTKLTNLSYSQLIPINSDEFKKLHEITSDVRDLLDYPIEPKPAEWSVEDERILKGIIGLIDHNQHYGVGNKEMLDWLKSLRPPLKDKEMKLKILKYLSTRCSSLEFEEVEDYLNNLRPSWKPSEEQMEALEHFIRSWGESGTMGPQNTILCAAKSLYANLQKTTLADVNSFQICEKVGF